MMHSTIHFSLGMLLGTALTYRPILAARRQGKRLAPLLRRWLIIAYALGVYAIIPNLLRRAGVPHDLCEAWLMNVFLFSPLLNRLMQGGTMPGQFLLSMLVASQYSALIWAVHRATSHKKAADRI
ncbi:MAG: hypothetical protein HQ523_16880 [Lentisphaerae bacterium]|nr:hypothetical protein [Lentisphaerota bacterium]